MISIGSHLARLGLSLVLITAATGLPIRRAYAAPGDIDPSFGDFGTGGTVITHRPSELIVNDMALQPDGRIVVAGSTGASVLIMRYLPDGSLDTTFSQDGIAVLSHPEFGARANAVAIQADGRIVIAGWVDIVPASFMLMRATALGALDTSFGTAGFVVTDWDNETDIAEAVLIQPDGKIVAAGYSLIGGDWDFAIARYLDNGLLDASFAGDGRGSVHFGGEDRAFDVALQDDGKLVLAGTSDDIDFSLDVDFAVARLNSNGTPDRSFDGDGELTTGFGGLSETARAVIIQPDGKIIAAGDNSDPVSPAGDAVDVKVARYWPDGEPDDSFDGDGKLSIEGLKGEIADAALQPDGRIVLLGYHQAPDGDQQFALYRLNPNGALDPTFDNDGVSFVDFGVLGQGTALALLPDGRLLASGYNAVDRTHIVLRLWPDGSLAGGGQQTLGFPPAAFGLGSNESATGLALQGDGKIVIVGEVLIPGVEESDMALARFLPGGLPDTLFGHQGRVQFGFGERDGARAVAVQPDGRIVVGGYLDPAGSIPANFMVARFTPDGAEDGTFGFGGFNAVDFMGGEDHATALALGPDGKIILAGVAFNGARHVFGIARFNADGTLDTSFDTDGKQQVEFVPGLSHTATAVAVQPDGKIVVAGTVGGDFGLLRLNENGGLDNTFGLSGLTRTDMGGDDALHALVRLPDGGFVAAGTRTVGSNGDFALAQYTPNGTLAGCPPFPCHTWPAGKAFATWGLTDAAYAVDWRSDGSIVAAGCAGEHFAWAQFRTDTLVGGPLEATTDFVGAACAAGVKFDGPSSLLVAGTQQFNGDLNFALARFETTVDPDAPLFRVHLPLVGR